MVGAVIRNKSMRFSVKCGTNEVGNIEISKYVSGTNGALNNYDQEFDFTLTLNNCDIDGKYGDLNFTDGVSHFTLKHGESRTAEYLPAGITYTVTEAPDDSFTVTSENDQGVIEKDQTVTAAFTNTRNGGRPTPPPVIPPVPPVPPERPVIPVFPLVPPEKPILPIVPVNPVDPAPETPLVPLIPVVPVTPVDPEQPPETPEAPDPDDTEHSSKDDVKDHTSPDTETLVDTETPAESDAPETAEKTETTEHLPVPQTGDSTNLGFWLIVLAAAFAGLCYPAVKKKRRNVE